jgi:hypothetical protein
LIGRHATDGHEPRQVRKEAAISDAVRVVGRSRSCRCNAASTPDSIEGAQPSSSLLDRPLRSHRDGCPKFNINYNLLKINEIKIKQQTSPRLASYRSGNRSVKRMAVD